VARESLLDAGLVREAARPGNGRTYGATFFEPVPDAALVLGLDIGARFLRGAICDLRGDLRARQDVEVAGADVAQVIDAAVALRERLLEAGDLSPEAVDGVVAGVPGVVEAPGGRVALAENVPGLEGVAIGPALEERLGVRVTVENDVNLAAVGERWRGVAQGVDDFAFLSVGTGLGAGLVLGGELHRGRHGAAGEVDFALGGGTAAPHDPAAPALAAYAAGLAAQGAHPTTLEPPFDARDVFRAARSGDALAQAVVDEEARRIAAHIMPVAAVADVALVVIGGGIGTNGDLLLTRIRDALTPLPYPPQVEVSSLGDSAVLAGALAIGLRDALDNVFAKRAPRGA
jgi:predicted NBD/HSP70 family sugar kinase